MGFSARIDGEPFRPKLQFFIIRLTWIIEIGLIAVKQRKNRAQIIQLFLLILLLLALDAAQQLRHYGQIEQRQETGKLLVLTREQKRREIRRRRGPSIMTTIGRHQRSTILFRKIRLTIRCFRRLGRRRRGRRLSFSSRRPASMLAIRLDRALRGLRIH